MVSLTQRGVALLLVVLRLAVWVGASGCATLVNGTSDEVRILTVPEQADFEIRDESDTVIAFGQTPMWAEVSRGGRYMRGPRYSVQIRKEGYEPTSFKLSSRISPWYFLNILFFPLVGMLIVDPLAGGMWDLRDPAAVTLEAAPAPPLVPASDTRQ